MLRIPKSSNITTHLKSLQWLSVKVRSIYKIAYLCYHCHNNATPSYVTDMLQKEPSHIHSTRSSSYAMPLLNRPAHSKASSVWNSIPYDVRCALSLSLFKSRLKTFVSFSLQKLNFLFDHCTYVHGLSLL